MEKNKIKIKLKWKIFGFLLGFCLFLLVVLWLFQIVFLNDFYRHIRISEIRNSASIIISSINNENLPEIVSALSEDGDFTADIVGLDGRSVLRPPSSASQLPSPASQIGLDSPMRAMPQDYMLNTALITRAAENGGEYYQYFSALADNEIRFQPGRQSGNRSQPFRQRMQTESLVYVKTLNDTAIIINAVITPVNATVTTLRSQLLMISVIMLLMAVILAVFIARHVSKPIEVINNSARNLASGNYSTHFSGKGFSEIEELSETLNTTAAELGKTESLRRELLANVSHDLLTPLTLIYSYAEMMCDFPAEITKEQAVVIMDETKRLTSLVNDVMDISKLEAGMENLNISRVNLTKNTGETIDVLRELLKNQKYQIDFIYDSDVFIDADETKINRAFYNLLVNAVNYSGGSRAVSVTQTVTDANVRISVTDSGEGISGEELPFIWDRYYRSGKAHKRAVTGTGLGLSIVKKIVEMHGGDYGVVSQAGRGSTFWFELEKKRDFS